MAEDINVNINVKGASDGGKKVDKLGSNLKKTKGDAESLGASLGEAWGEVNILGTSLGSVSKAFKTTAATSKLMFKSIKVGLISTGIGAFVVAIGSLATYFSQTKKGAELLETTLATLGAGIKVITDRIANFGGSIVKIFKGDFKGAAKDMKDAFTGIGTEIKKEVKLANDLAKATIKVRDSQRLLNIETAKQRAEVEALKLIAEDMSLDEKTRLDAAREAFAIEQDLLDKRVANAEEELRIQQEQMAMGENTAEDLDREAELIIKVANLKQESGTKQIELNNKINGIEREMAAKREQERVKEEQAEKDRIKAIEDEGLALAKLNSQRDQESQDRNKQYADVQRGLQDSLTQQLDALKEAKLAEQKVVSMQYLYEELSFEENQQMMRAIREKYDALEQEAIANSNNGEIAQNAETLDAMIQQRLQFAGSIMSSIDSIAATQTQKEISALDKAFKAGSMSEEAYQKKKEKLEKKAIQREKRMAMFQLLINTASSVSEGIRGAMQSATATGPGAVFSAPGFVASMIALALSSVAQGYAILNKVPGGGGGSGGGGGGGEGGGGGGQQFQSMIPEQLAESFENEDGAPQPIQAYVVENDISNAQALQEDLETQATL